MLKNNYFSSLFLLSYFKMKGLKVAKSIVLILLVLAFLIQVKDSLNKFINHKTTMSVTRIAMPAQNLPTISFCPGFKHRNITNAFVTYFDMNPESGVCVCVIRVLFQVSHSVSNCPYYP